MNFGLKANLGVKFYRQDKEVSIIVLAMAMVMANPKVFIAFAQFFFFFEVDPRAKLDQTN